LEVEEKERVGQLHIVQMDVTVPETVQTVVQQIVQEQSRLDVVVNNAGKSLIGWTESVSIEQAKQLFEVNFWGVVKYVAFCGVSDILAFSRLLFHNSEPSAEAE
jgi:NADP-dependent 3-hydroxy acid dehydrogenase YdfG